MCKDCEKGLFYFNFLKFLDNILKTKRKKELTQKTDLSDLLLEPQEDNKISQKTIHIFLFIIVLLIISSIYTLMNSENKESFFKNKLENKEVVVKKETKAPAKTIKKEEPVKVIKKEEPIKIVKKDTSKIKSRKYIPIIKLNNDLKITKSTRYIQVAAFPNSVNDKQLIRKIQGNELKYKIVKGSKYTRVLIGPYKNFDEADIAIAKIKEKIRKDSFITSKFK